MAIFNSYVSLPEGNLHNPHFWVPFLSDSPISAFQQSRRLQGAEIHGKDPGRNCAWSAWRVTGWVCSRETYYYTYIYIIYIYIYKSYISYIYIYHIYHIYIIYIIYISYIYKSYISYIYIIYIYINHIYHIYIYHIYNTYIYIHIHEGNGVNNFEKSQHQIFFLDGSTWNGYLFTLDKQLEHYTWWLIPLSKWVITPVISGLTLLIPFITGVITHLLSGMSHQV